MAWIDRRDERSSRDPKTLRLAVLSWSRLHGLVSLELEGAFAAMDLDPDLLFADEIDALLRASA